MDYLILSALWIGWCVVHSLPVAPTVTAYFRRRLGERFRFYRVIYNMLAVLTLLPVLAYTFSLQGDTLFEWEGYLAVVPYALIFVSGLLFLSGMRHYDMAQFLGLRQLKERKDCKAITEDCSLDTSGILGATRHPWYLGGILIVWARDLDISALITNAIITGYFIIGTFLEERKLVRQFGADYRNYQQRVSMLLPYKWLKTRMKSFLKGA